MMHQIFPVPRTFNQQPQRRRRAARRRAMLRSRPKVELGSAHTGGGRQHSDRWSPSSLQPRADKIAQLRHAVESGNYRVGAEQIAEKMVHEALVVMLTWGLWEEQS